MKKAWLFAIIAALALPALAEETNQSSQTAEYKQISADYEKEQREFATTYQNTPEAERKNLKYPEVTPYSKKMIALAEKEPKSSVAADALIWAVRHSYHDQSVGPQAIALLKENHIENEKLGSACQMLAYNNSKENREFLNTVVEKNPHDKVKGAASLALGQMLASENPAEAEKHLNAVIEKYGSKSQKESARGQLFEMHNLAIGKVAPEIEGEDVDGKKFKLSDYRGKVVVIDFWGDW
jgi:hypothetical protein